MVGIRVRERRYEASMAKTTASASGRNRYPEMPSKKRIGTKTMQILRVATKAGTAICCAPVRMVSRRLFPSGSRRLMFSISTVASSTRMPTARARPPRVMMLMVSPMAPSSRMETRMESGMEMPTIKVLRRLPRKSKIMTAVRAAAMTASFKTPCTAFRTKIDWSASGWMCNSCGSVAAMRGRASRTRETMSKVDALPLLMIVKSAERCPSRRTMLVWNWKPSWTLATSRT